MSSLSVGSLPARTRDRPTREVRTVRCCRIVAAVAGLALLVWFSVQERPADAALSASAVPAMRLSVSTPVLRGQQPGTASSSAIAAGTALPPTSHVPRPDRLAGGRPSDLNDGRVLVPAPREDPGRPPMVAEVRPAQAPGALLADEQRGVALLAAGLRDEASIVFDSIVFRDPLHRLDPAAVTADAVAVFKRSKQVLLPSLAAHEYEAARAAFAGGDYARAVAGTERASTLLDDPDLAVVPPELRADVSRLRASAIAARTTLDEKIYSSADLDVSPPRPVGRQLPALRPAGLTDQTTGRLEVLINSAGQVEAVKLHSPLNAYHDRMIVSAAKAWRYRPALRNGKPVRFSLVLSINLPESN